MSAQQTTTQNESVASVLIVDDERHTREGLERALGRTYRVLTAESGERGLELLDAEPVDVVLADLRMPGMDGLTFIKRATAKEDAPLVIMLTAYGSVQTAVEAMKVGAYDYLAKPVNLDNLEMMIQRGLEARHLKKENEKLRHELDKEYGLEGIIGNSKSMNEVLEKVRQVASARTTVLLTGESGTGKELIAHAIHQLSPRIDKPFLVVHCAALNPNLLESELFGHEKGAYTGAHERREGRFEKADGGTLFLDEIGEVDLSTQIKLLRVLETRSFERVGGTNPVTVDVRLIAATNSDLKQAVNERKFREDLYYRLNVVNIRLPALRERKEDIPALMNHFLKEFAKENGKDISGISPEAIRVLQTYSWPGNVRELRNCVERMVVMARGRTLTLGDVPSDIRRGVADDMATEGEEQNGGSGEEEMTSAQHGTGRYDINAHEKELICKALDDCNGNRAQAARKLGISRRTLYRKIQSYGL